MVNTVQKKIGLLIGIIGIIAILDNIYNITSLGNGFYSTISDPTIWLLFLTIIPFLISIFFESSFLKILQSILIIFTGLMSMIESYDAVYGPGLILAAWLLMRYYGYFEFHTKIKYSAFLILNILFTQLSATINENGNLDAGLQMLEYSIFISVFLIIIWHDIVLDQKNLRIENRSLKINYTRIRDQLIQLEEEHKIFNLKAVKITPAEERVIKILTIYKASNREISERLNIAESTVKLHLYNIYNKIGVDNRFAIIELCKYNYT